MSDTAVLTRDHQAAVEALKFRFGVNYVILGARSNPLGAVNAAILAWEGEDVADSDRDLATQQDTYLPFFPRFKETYTTDGVVNEIAVFLQKRDEQRAQLVADRQSNQEALSPSLGNLEDRANRRLNLGGFTIVELRKASRGLVEGGYSLKKPELIEALVDAGVNRDAVEAANKR